ncbi:MAG: SO_0444 family Cu/Zn efflux transporter [Candidatus Omnitrophota bacterium]
MNVIIGIIKEAYFLLNKMAPYLLFGYLFAGIIHIFIDQAMVSRHLGGSNLFSVIKAALFGIPLPLCSCGVIPAAMSLRKEGASRGAVLSFLISTPTTGVDSIFATYSLMGGLFTIYRILASFITGVLSGIAANFFIREPVTPQEEKAKCKLCDEEREHIHAPSHQIRGAFTYAFGDLLSDTGGPLLLGILIGGVITYFLPGDFISKYLGSGIIAMFVMLIVGIPMYVCATASIPIASALILKGINPGAAFVFLVAGPATNVVTMTVVAQNIGRKALVIYLGSIAFGSIAMGLLLDRIYLYFYQGEAIRTMLPHKELLPEWLGFTAAIVLVALIVFNFVREKLIK